MLRTDADQRHTDVKLIHCESIDRRRYEKWSMAHVSLSDIDPATKIEWPEFDPYSITGLLVAGVVPGILLSTLFVGYIVIRCWLNPSLAPAFDVTYSYNKNITVSIGANNLFDKTPPIAPVGTLAAQPGMARISVRPADGGAARDVAEAGDPTRAAIAPVGAAEVYGLLILRNDLQDMQHIVDQFIHYLRGTDVESYRFTSFSLDQWLHERVATWQARHHPAPDDQVQAEGEEQRQRHRRELPEREHGHEEQVARQRRPQRRVVGIEAGELGLELVLQALEIDVDAGRLGHVGRSLSDLAGGGRGRRSRCRARRSSGLPERKDFIRMLPSIEEFTT
mgnify:CR=1 FL=1